MMTYRPITTNDVPAVTTLAVEALRFGMGADALHVSEAKVQSMVSGFAEQPGHFQLAAFKDNQPVGAIAVYVSEMPFFERCEGHIVMCYCTEPHAGVRLIRSMLNWAAADMRIRRLVWAMNAGADQFARVLARRFGFDQRSMLVYVK